MLKRLMVVLILMLMVASSTIAFAWWDNLSQTDDQTLLIGQGVTLEVDTVVTVPEGKVLVPKGIVMKVGDVDLIELTYNVKLDYEVIENLDLSVTAKNILIGESDKNSDLVDIDIVLSQDQVNSEDVLVKVYISLNMPESEAQYKEIINQKITFTLNFEANQRVV